MVGLRFTKDSEHVGASGDETGAIARPIECLSDEAELDGRACTALGVSWERFDLVPMLANISCTLRY